MSSSAPHRSALYYEPLRKGWIRLAILQPGSLGDPIHIRLEPAPLLPHPSRYFEALSYVWGAPTGVQFGMLVVNGAETSATRNLMLALQRLRFTDRERSLWVDALCINQDDLRERSQQVELMATIYKLADKVLIHLGPRTSRKDDEAMDIIAAVDQPLTAETASRVSDSILTRPWFGRVWVVQEAALARVAIVILGDKTVRWDCFTAWPMRIAPFRIERAMPGILGLPPRFQPVEGSFLQRLHETRPLMATDPRDKVFGLLGLIPDRDPWLKLVDYSMACERVYTEVARCFVEKENSLRFLSAIHRVPSLASSSPSLHPDSMPSWVCDWSFNPDIVPLGIGREFQEPYNAGGYPPVAEVVRNRLVATGIVLDTVTWVGSPYADSSPPSEAPTTIDINTSIGSPSDNSEPSSTAEHGAPWPRIFDLFRIRPPSTGPKCLQTVPDWAGLFQVPLDSDPLTCCKDASVSFRALTTAAPPSSLQRDEEIHCRRWKSKAGLAHLQHPDAPLDRVCFRRRIFQTKSGLLGLGPQDMRSGDRVVVLLGGPVPYVLRKAEHEQANNFIGECYVLGAMGGEALKHLHHELRKYGHYLGPCGSPICDGKLEMFEIV